MELPRRTLVGVALTAGALTACNPEGRARAGAPTARRRRLRRGARQRGVADPLPRQRYLALRVLDLVDTPSADLPTVLADLGAPITRLGAPTA